ncbi:MAG: hypothetical protein AAFP84_12630 [Actinomycetota bacterium]
MVVDDIVVFGIDGRPIRSMATLRTWVPDHRSWAMNFLYALEPRESIELHGRRVGTEIHLLARNATTGRSAPVRFHAITGTSLCWTQSDVEGNVDVHIS